MRGTEEDFDSNVQENCYHPEQMAFTKAPLTPVPFYFR
jgi:hypothetical protein